MSQAINAIMISILFVASGACTSKEKNQVAASTTQGAEVSLDPSLYLRLQNFTSCDTTDNFLRDNMRKILKDAFDQQRYQLEHWKDLQVSTNESTSEVSKSAPTSASDSGSGPQEFSRTNTQLATVDEPDRVKTDGKTIYAISGSSVQVTASWPVENMQKLTSIEFKGEPLGLLLTEDQKLVVIYHPAAQSFGKQASKEIYAPTSQAYPWSQEYGSPYLVRLAVYNVEQAAQPQLIKEYTFLGNYLSLRRQGNLIRMVQTFSGIEFPEGVQPYLELSSQTARADGSYIYRPISLKEFDQKRAEIDEKNARLIDSFKLKSFLSKTMADSGLSSDDPLLSDTYDCTQIYASQEIKTLGMTSVTSLNLLDGQLSQAAILAPADQLYASEGSLYLAQTLYSWWRGWNLAQDSKTFLHKFKYEAVDSVKIAYQGSGMIEGRLLNQFAMDEYQDVLRVAVTATIESKESSPPADTISKDLPRTTAMETGGSGTSINRVLTLAPGPEGLIELGRTPDLAPGESIFGVRFMKEKGYVVTFRQVDPLYTLDLRDPKAPQVVGELKISGYSAYIHSLDESHLLTVGEEVDPVSMRRVGLKISVFDVSDPSKPKEKWKHVSQDAYSSSEALYDHHAFNWFASRNLLALPVSGYRETSQSVASNWWSSYFAELQVFSIDLNKGIEAKGAVSVNDLYQGKAVPWYDWQWMAQPSRSIFADDYIYAISSLGISAVRYPDLSTSIKTAPFYP